MDKKIQTIIGVVAVFGLVLYFYDKSQKVKTSNQLVDDDTTETALGNINVCTAMGQIPCQNNNLKCYNPSVNYFSDPCA
jgi:hypothetical protein